jgi:predicted RNA-binding protein YlqC (UPF0109 family)
MSEKENTIEFVRYVLSQICENTNDIRVEAMDDARGTLVTIYVKEEDMGRLIGKEGQTISALRTLLSVLSARGGFRMNLKVADPL